MNNLICNIGINDIPNSSKDKPYITWKHLINRSYSIIYADKFRYIKTEICDKWLIYSNFLKWYNKHYKKGLYLCRNLYNIHNTLYSPYTCCFVPKEIMNFLSINRNIKGCCKNSYGKYVIQIYSNNKLIKSRNFNTEKEAYAAYVYNKQEQAKELAIKYKNVINKKAYNTLYNFKIA